MPVAVPFSTLTEMFDLVTKKFASTNRPVYKQKIEGKYVDISYSQLRQDVELFAMGLASLGIRRGDHLSVISENRSEWIIADIAMMVIGAIDCPIYPTLTSRQIEFIFNDAGVKIAVVSNQFQLNKVLKCRSDVRSMKKIIVMADRVENADDNVLLFTDVLRMGESFSRENPSYIEHSLLQIKPSDVATIIYTSGTTGNPKGVMLSHHNIVFDATSAVQNIPIDQTDVLLSFLPLCHSFERIGGYTLGFACGATVAFAESVDKVAENMLEVKPTIITTVPRLFERIYGKIKRSIEAGPPNKQKIFNWAIDVGRKYAEARRNHMLGPSLKIKHLLADKLVFEKIRSRTGGNMKFFVSGGAALSRDLGEFFEAIGIKILEGYGLSETSPVISINRYDDYKFGTVGKPISGIEVRIANDGEILTRGPHVMIGYWNSKEATREIIDSDGWLHTGDIGVFDAAGFLMITDRKKHLFVSSGGKNIAPQPIENMFMQSKFVDQFVLIGDRRMFLSALIVPDFDAIREYADTHKISYNDIQDLVDHPDIYKAIEKDIGIIQKDLANYERVRKFMLLQKKLTIEDGEITPTMKVKRKAIEERYRDMIEKMYSGFE
ncbi:MAG: long-chain fatty acid--CoA ligase [Bacteroidota bacterium]